MEPTTAIRRRLLVTGIVQGVGFRPYVFGLARGLGLTGWVRNDPGGVTIEVQGPPEAVGSLATRLGREAPPLARIESVHVEGLPLGDEGEFVIGPSHGRAAASALVSADVATCGDCLREVLDPADRRCGYPFANCTNCGPRYSIVTGIPYDRPNTTMAGFEMCHRCGAEYGDPLDRRFHAQPVCCADCGPALSRGIAEVAAALRRGEIAAVKGLGGYHLATLASDETAVATLRNRKHREDKPFALMAADLAAVRRLCVTSPAEEDLLVSPARPIVLLRRRQAASVAASVAPQTIELGVMLPYTPLHHLLLAEVGEPIVCTSGNLSDEPIAYLDSDARERLGPVADLVVGHDRPIHMRVDDSVARVLDGRPYLLRRSRGYAPAPIRVPQAAVRPVLACGADLKNTVAVARDNHVFMSQHVGDLADALAHEAFAESVAHLQRLFEVEPAVVAFDLHPQYLSSAFGREQTGLVQVPVQHHHGHVAACLADAGLAGPVIGVAFDGLGHGDDGTVWGGEFLVADLLGYERRGWLAPVPMPGGDAATREPWRMAASYLDALGEAGAPDLAVARRHDRWSQVVQLGRSGVRSPPTSSAGRLFDAVAALLDVRDVVSYEGQAACELEQVADRTHGNAYRAGVEAGAGNYVVQGLELVADVLADLRSRVDRPLIAARFHRGLAQAIVEVCRALRRETGLGTVALSGGCFANVILTEAATDGLRAEGFEVLRHHQVPCNDGGLSLGQAAVAAARDRAGLLEDGSRRRA